MRRVAVAVLLLAAGCAGGADGGDGEPFGSCAIFPRSGGASVTFEGFGAERTCDDLIQSYAEQGELWTRNDPGHQRAVICRLEDPSGAGFVTVADTGGAFVGERICAALIAADWAERP